MSLCLSGPYNKPQTKIADTSDSQASPRHTTKTATVAPFRAWRGLRPVIAWDPAVTSIGNLRFQAENVFQLTVSNRVNSFTFKTTILNESGIITLK